ncbi:MAG TPA: phospho-N-acetylmuramoyl-pentapeptide-transferase [Halanaerobiales bacterium]|nr:phospho-N-acetylmuramoyl-pentapeptide-transferase [Halanaerobiales bacterium]
MSYLMKSLIFFAAPLLWVLLLTPYFIKLLKKYELGQNVREVGPESHYEKEGIPTMGGLLIVTGIIIPVILTGSFSINNIIFILILVSTAIIGFSDDFIKISKDRSLGLTARQKIFLQFIIGLVLGLYVYFYLPEARNILIPFIKIDFNMGAYIIPVIILTYLSAVNAVNLTDGLDGLAASITAVVALTLYIILFFSFFNQVSLLSLSITGACIGFLWYNSKPASIFMGDVGSLSLGAALAVLFSYTGLEIVLIFVGGIYVLEALSVIIQVIYFKVTKGERIFLMSPLHHHYELKGLSESKIVYRFTIVSIMFSLFSILITI